MINLAFALAASFTYSGDLNTNATIDITAGFDPAGLVATGGAIDPIGLTAGAADLFATGPDIDINGIQVALGPVIDIEEG